EIRLRIASSLFFKDLASCTRVTQDWNDSFTPPLYNTVVLSIHGLRMETVERNMLLIRRLEVRSSAYEKLSSAPAREKVVFSVMANSTLTTLNLWDNSIRDNGAQALSEALKTNSTLTTLDLGCILIGSNGGQALSKALNINSTLTTLDFRDNSIGDNGA
ncbi:hypothetical protein BGZ96_005384, partial [Linnemannia gamsii]